VCVVVAIGGNALLRRGEPLDAASQRRNAGTAAASIAALAADHQVVLVHGNGPQVGLLALQSVAYEAVAPYPLDILGAETGGMVGYILQQELANRLAGRDVACVLTQVVVDRDDAAFADPTKPIGPVFEKSEAERLAARHGWTVAPDGNGYRRVVPSPAPRHIVEMRTIRRLVADGVVVVCLGGGGIPVTAEADGTLRGVEAVIDKDRAAALLAVEIGADALLLLTDVPGIYLDWGTPRQRLVRSAGGDRLAALGLDRGSMGPKVEACVRFATAAGGLAAIGRLDQPASLLDGSAGTRVLAGSGAIRLRDD